MSSLLIVMHHRQSKCMQDYIRALIGFVIQLSLLSKRTQIQGSIFLDDHHPGKGCGTGVVKGQVGGCNCAFEVNKCCF